MTKNNAAIRFSDTTFPYRNYQSNKALLMFYTKKSLKKNRQTTSNLRLPAYKNRVETLQGSPSNRIEIFKYLQQGILSLTNAY